jgi:hypothetical protein
LDLTGEFGLRGLQLCLRRSLLRGRGVGSFRRSFGRFGFLFVGLNDDRAVPPGIGGGPLPPSNPVPGGGAGALPAVFVWPVFWAGLFWVALPTLPSVLLSFATF